jgi:DNA-binding MarR family transcriptional regulator
MDAAGPASVTERDGTDAGRDLVETEFPRCVDHDRELLAGLDDDEQATLAALLRRISSNAERTR